MIRGFASDVNRPADRAKRQCDLVAANRWTSALHAVHFLVR